MFKKASIEVLWYASFLMCVSFLLVLFFLFSLLSPPSSLSDSFSALIANIPMRKETFSSKPPLEEALFCSLLYY